MPSRTGRIRALNDQLRATGRGGIVLLARGVAALPPEIQAAIIDAVRRFDDFSVANDPYGEHDCAVLETAGHEVLFKIGYYDPALRSGSADPADPLLTRRVLTIMLADEY